MIINNNFMLFPSWRIFHSIQFESFFFFSSLTEFLGYEGVTDLTSKDCQSIQRFTQNVK